MWLLVGCILFLLVPEGLFNRDVRKRAPPKRDELDLRETRVASSVESHRVAKSVLAVSTRQGASAVRGVVVDIDGNPVPDAVVALVPSSSRRATVSLQRLGEESRLDVSDTVGRFEIGIGDVGGDSGTVVVRKPGYLASSMPLAQPMARNDLRIVLEPGLAITGRVVLGMIRETVGLAGVRVVARGTGAPVKAGVPDEFPVQGALFQETITETDGSFVVSGLAAGSYQLEVVSPGLTAAPKSIVDGVFSLHDRTAWAEAGTTGVVLSVVPVAMGLMKVVDRDTGAASARFTHSIETPDGWHGWPRDIMNSYNTMVVNGTTCTIEGARLPSATFGF